MRKILCFILSLVMVLTVSAAFGESTAGLTKDIKILFTSDVHCGIDQGWGYSGIYAVKENLARDYHVLLVDNGDAIQGEPVGLLTKGKAIIRIMNATGYDIAIPGNHEFDFGMENFLSLAGEAEFPYISCNFNKEGTLVFPAYVIREFDGVKIAFIGVTTPMTLRDSAPKYFMDGYGSYIYGFFQDENGKKLSEAIQQAVDSARAEGCEYVIALAHLGNEEEVSPWMYSEMISRTTGIDAWLDGHSHDTDHVEMKDKSGRVVVRQACGTKNANIGLLTIATDGTITAELLPWSASVSAPKLLGFSNPAAEAVAEVKSELDRSMDAVIATSTADLVINDPVAVREDGRPVRIIQNTETNLGDLIADAYLDHYKNADIALVNASGIRANIAKGEVSLNDILKTLPYGTKVALAEVTGQQILDALEWSVHAIPAEFGGFEHPAGLSFEFNPNIPTPCVEDEEKMFVRVDDTKPRRVSNVLVGGNPIEPDATYRLVSNVYILMDGDGFTMFRGAKILNESDEADSDVLLAYISGLDGGVIGEEYADPYGQGRISAIQ